MADGITLRPTQNPHEPPDHVKLVVETVRSLSNKYVPTPSLDECEGHVHARRGSYGSPDPSRKGGSDEGEESPKKELVGGWIRRVVFFSSDVCAI